MNFKLTLALIFVAAIAGAVYFLNPFEKEEEKALPRPWFYQVSVDDMTSIGVQSEGYDVLFNKTSEGTWAFDIEGDIPPDHMRWGGIAYLLGGPQTKRDLTETKLIIEDPAEYGLADPHTIVDIGLTFDRYLQFRLGDKTTDGDHHYGQISGFPQLFLIADTWGEVVSRLAKEPPYPKYYVIRNPKSIEEFNLFPTTDDPDSDPAQLSFTKKNGEWVVTDYLVSADPHPVDVSKWEKILPLLSRPEGMKIHRHKVEDRDYTEWGIGDNSLSIEMRFRGVSESGTNYVDGVLLIIGDKSEEGDYYYGLNSQEGSMQPVLLLPAQWVDTLSGLYDEIPYANR